MIFFCFVDVIVIVELITGFLPFFIYILNNENNNSRNEHTYFSKLKTKSISNEENFFFGIIYPKWQKKYQLKKMNWDFFFFFYKQSKKEYHKK